MNRTIEQWKEVADTECKFHSVLNEAISDLQELARQRDELAAMLESASNYVDNLGGDSKKYRMAVSKIKEQSK